jgi:hypothetical protein
MRLCLNSFALKSGPDEDELVAECMRKALNAAMSTIQIHFESSQSDIALSFATDVSGLASSSMTTAEKNVLQYMTITLAQAAVFLIRVNRAAPSIRAVANLDPSVAAHYLKMSVNVLESSDMSETRLSTYLAKTIRDISRAAGISGMSPLPRHPDLEAQSKYTLPPLVPDGSGIVPEALNVNRLLQVDDQFDLGYLLGLPGDGNAVLAPGLLGGMAGGLGNGIGGTVGGLENEYNWEFGFGMGGLGSLGNGFPLGFSGDG